MKEFPSAHQSVESPGMAPPGQLDPLSSSAFPRCRPSKTEWLLLLAVLAILVPFISKPLNADDPLFVWAARQIRVHPLSPYGFDVNWYGTLSPMWQVMQNPPLAGYYLAAAGSLLGWGEPVLHGAMVLAALAAVAGTYRLGLRLTSQPGLAALATFVTPVFLVSSTTLMCDILMLAFWVWAVVLWTEGIERGDGRRLGAAAILISLAAMTKYFGACLIPLLGLHAFLGKRRIGAWAVHLLFPIAVLGAYEWGTRACYGKGLLSEAAAYAGAAREAVHGGPANLLTALAFTGGCLAAASLASVLFWRPRTLSGLVLLTGLIAAVPIATGGLLRPYDGLSSPGLVEMQVVFWAICGASVLALAVEDAWLRRQDPASWLLVFWVCGTFLFAAFLNWIVNARSILPMAPAVGILLARRMDRAGGRKWFALAPGTGGWGVARLLLSGPGGAGPGVLVCLSAGAVLALAVARADFLLAKADRQSASAAYEKYGRGSQTLWFEGHWGFQYYIEASGPSVRAVVAQHSFPRAGDHLAIPFNNANIDAPDPRFWHPAELISLEGPRWVATGSKEAGAGFYASVYGPLPFAFGRVPPERVFIYTLGAAAR